MWEMNKMEIDIGLHIKNIFLEKWEEAFIVNDQNEISYKLFFQDITDLKTHLEEMNINENDKVCLIMQNSYDLLLHYFALALLQSIIIPVDPLKGKDDIDEIISLVSPDFVLKESTSITKQCEISKSDLSLWDNLRYDSTYLISYTSGSTGKPKGVCHSFKNLYLAATEFNNHCQVKENQTFAHILPMTYMAGILNLIFVPFFAKCKIVLFERFSVSNCSLFWEKAIRHSIKYYWFTPTIVSLLEKFDRNDKSIEFCKQNNLTIFVGTAPLYKQVKEKFESKYYTKLYESYGLSETLFVTSNCTKYPEKENSVGKPLKGVVNITAADNELIIKTPWNFLGYYNQSNVDVNNFYSGDLAEIDNEAYIYITGRKKDLIIRGGINISPYKIEQFINSTGLFEEIVVLGIPDLNIGEKTICFYSGLELDKSILKRTNKELVAKHGKDYIIDKFINIAEIPKNTNLKIDKPYLRKEYPKGN